MPAERHRVNRLLSVDDLTDDAIVGVLARADELQAGSAPHASARHPALVFFEPSLRTRTGFISAAHRLGWPTPVEVIERRASAESMPERMSDTIAVASAYFDTLIVRPGAPIDSIAPHVPASCALINAGDRGPRAEHPTQTLIDLFAMSRLVGALENLSVVLVGDLRMRSARSLLKILARTRPRDLVLVTDPTLTDGLELPADLPPTRIVDHFGEVEDADAIHALGIPNNTCSEAVRTRLRVDKEALERLSSRGRVFSPMPVIDEIDRAVRGDPRLAFIEQSALGLYTRMAVLESLRPPNR
jgi:aspartate carbamoyltransferase catalytic subunit